MLKARVIFQNAEKILLNLYNPTPAKGIKSVFLHQYEFFVGIIKSLVYFYTCKTQKKENL